MTTVICYRDKRSPGCVSFDNKVDFKEIRMLQGYENFEIIDEAICNSKKQIRAFEKRIKEKLK